MHTVSHLWWTECIDLLPNRDYIVFLSSTGNKIDKEINTGKKEQEQEPLEEEEKIDYDEKYTFIQTEYWECINQFEGFSHYHAVG